MAPRRALAKKESSNLPLQIALQEPILGHFNLGKEWDEAIANYRHMPDALLGQLLEARLIGGLHRRRSRELLDHVLRAAPESPCLLLRLTDQYPDQGASWPPAAILVAEQYPKCKVRLDRVPALVSQGLEQIQMQEKYRRDSDVVPKVPGLDNIALTQSRARQILIRHAIATDQHDRAKALLTDDRRSLEAANPGNNASRAASKWRNERHTYRELAKLAGVEATPIAEADSAGNRRSAFLSPTLR